MEKRSQPTCLITVLVLVVVEDWKTNSIILLERTSLPPYVLFNYFTWHLSPGNNDIVVVVVVFTLTDRASTIPSNIRGCQSGTWSQRGTKVNRSHHGDNPLLRPTGIQIATKSYATLQAMAPTNSKTVHQTSFTPYREQYHTSIVL